MSVGRARDARLGPASTSPARRATWTTSRRPTGCLHLAFGLSDVARGRSPRSTSSAVRARAGRGAGAGGRRPARAPPTARPRPTTSRSSATARSTTSASRCSSWSPRATSPRARPPGSAAPRSPPRRRVLTIDDAVAAEPIFEEGPRVWTKATPARRSPPRRAASPARMEIGGQEHFYLEGQAALAVPSDGEMEVHSSTQHPSEIQHKVADALGLPMADVRVVVRRMGGGFGGKESQGNALAIACAVAAEMTGRPCRMRYDRDDDMTITGKRHDFRVGYERGVRRRGPHPRARRRPTGRAAAGRWTCRCPWPTGRCSTPTTPT